MPEDKHLHDKYLSEPDPADIYFDYGPPLPEKYNQDTIFLLIHDPECIFAYWEVSGQITLDIASETALHTWKWAIRVYNLSVKSFNDIALPVPQDYSNIQGSCYIPVLSDNQYQVELGAFKANVFMPLVKSNIVWTPRKGKAPLTNTTSYT